MHAAYYSYWIPVSDLVVGEYYKCRARNFRIGKWNGSGFEYMRTKFNLVYPDIEYHWDDKGPTGLVGTVKPLKRVSYE